MSPEASNVAGSRSHAIAAVALGMLLAAVYAVTMPPDITFEDVPLFAAACYSRGIVHPPGYPLHTLLCWPLASMADIMPLSIAQASALASLLPAVGACVIVAWLAWRETDSLPAGILAGGLLGLAPAFWRQAHIPEAYALNALLIAAAWAAVVSYVRAPRSSCLLVLALLCGLGLSNHWPLFAIPAPALGLWLLAARRSLLRDLADPRTAAGLAGMFVLGLLPYLHLVWPAEGSFRFLPEAGNDLWRYASRQHYGVGGENVGIGPWLATGAATAGWVLGEYTYVFGLAGLAGIVAMVRGGMLLQAAAVSWAVLSCTSMLYLLRPYVPESLLSQARFSVYPLPSYLWFALPIALAASLIVRRLRPSASVQWAACAAVLAATALSRLPDLDRSADDIAIRHAQLVRQQLPDKSLLILHTGDTQLPHGYLDFVSVDRPDISIVAEGDFFEFIDIAYELTSGQEQKLTSNPAVAFISDFQMRDHGRTYNGLFFTVGGAPPGKLHIDVPPASRDFSWSLIEALKKRGINNVWSENFADRHIYELAKMLSIAQDIEGHVLEPADRELLAGALSLPAGRLGRFVALATSGQLSPASVFIESERLGLDFSELQPQWKSDVLHLRGTALLLEGDPAGAVIQYEQALAANPQGGNYKALIDLLQLYSYLDRHESYRDLRLRFPELVTGQALVAADAACAERLGKPCAADVKESGL